MTTLTRRAFFQALRTAPHQILWPDWMPRLSFAPAHTAPRGDTLVVVFLRGAADALNMVVPHGDDSYYSLRPSLGIPRPDDPRFGDPARTLDLDGFFGLHPALAPLHAAWDLAHLAWVHACGAPDESRSHFKAMALMERGVEDEHGPASGWIGRHLASLDTGNPSPLRAIGLGARTPRSLQGSVPVTALRSIADFHLGGDLNAAARMRAALDTLYVPEDPLGEIGRETLAILDTIERIDPDAAPPPGGMQYPDSDFGRGLRQAALLIKAEVGLEVAAIDHGGWDTHFAQGGADGLMAGLLADLGQGLAALHADLADRMDCLTVVVMSEFGRRARENASLGTDHGHGGVMMLLGGNVVGGRVHADWPGLAHEQLFGPGDLAVTIDYRDVLAEVCARRLDNPNLEVIFPQYPARLRGILRGSPAAPSGEHLPDDQQE